MLANANSICSFQAEQRADLAERTMAKLQKEVDRLEGNYFSIADFSIS